MDEVKEKKQLVERIAKDMDDILYWRIKLIDDSTLPFEEVVEIRILVCKLWLKYYNLVHIFNKKP